MPEQFDNAALLRDADACLLKYGSNFLPEVVTRTENIYFWTASGKKVLDWTSGQMSCLIGHGHPEIVETITKHAIGLDHVYSSMVSPPVIELGMKLTKALPEGLDKAIFLSTGSESNECAIKLAKVVTGKFEIVGLAASWHGMTFGSNGAQYWNGRAGYGPTMPGNLMLPAPDEYRSIFRHADGSYDWKTELDYGWSLVDKQSCGSLAAVIMEPVLSSGGMMTLPDGYMKAMKAHCEARGMLLIVDEAQTGMGRCGDLIASNHHGVVPDILTLSKTLGNGLPLAATITSSRIAAEADAAGFLFYTTHVNDPLPAAVGLKVLRIIQRDNLVERAAVLGKLLHAGLERLMARYGCIGTVRGRGLMAGVEIVSDRETKKADTDLGRRLSERAFELGVSAMLSSQGSFYGCLRIAPPIVITQQQLEDGLNILEEAFRTTAGSKPLY
ncbi:hypothetical protein H112_03339 [Trichophyton rubrum D6]|nr:uncharacterized protein TERG_05943 [Trichophyton rubrum CBS 118892]EZF24105.1 hypothetical protein H100_03343 [Trichophyton rubrum MR850]EZF43107.1 hypothetical protein H102_03338 [Trichophyton rubrum CBS 100081]EZF53773.1 hypothetical protein H103_03350 [Trichophyton rubrum CBS 288.86]EZF64395.1 hypothetical protein H104_03333 [Trichophyton rubrum CBS 289.86]EZF74983.1 hypothetical protein H105_03356 [Trichophyton soudanense CBS 452.61]EZF85689.1 hypothetical protein H110_03344 [Trichophy